ncbi:MAG: hypothetical protein IPO15_17650 [Anaerolineae bacterium]|uniref:hypothetical protein n=1 Tax=Candidatus Amarolinea dominans TaxID=3140696 RepID=UPI00313682BE|nr:hypothetical protein [Anaerolineae bacterium]
MDYRIITFDYETFNTSVSDNAKTLQQALVKQGSGRRMGASSICMSTARLIGVAP